VLRLTDSREDGPLAVVNAISVQLATTPEQAIVWGTVLPDNLTAAPIAMVSIEAINPVGIDVLEIAQNDPTTEGAVGLQLSPIPGVTMHPIPGAFLPVYRSPSDARQILVTARLANLADIGTIDGLRFTYEAAGKSYVLDIPGTLTLALATPSPLAWRTDDDHASTCVRLRRV